MHDLSSYRSATQGCLSPLGEHRMAYRDWGPDAAGRTVVCVHGLSRNAGDFDVLAAALAAAGMRVLAVDVAGRGASDWLADPKLYGIPQYAQDLAGLLDDLAVEQVDWVGTSMGGIIGMALASKGHRKIRSLLLNDVGPMVPKAAIEEIAGYVGLVPVFADLDAVEAFLRETYEERFGPLPDHLWRHVAEQSVTRHPDGYRRNYDPAIAAPFKALAGQEITLWPLWDAITCPVMVIRGAQSDLLLPDTLAAMQARGPGCQTAEIPGVGHAPWLMDDHQVGLVRDWLAAQAP